MKPLTIAPLANANRKVPPSFARKVKSLSVTIPREQAGRLYTIA